MVFPIQQALAQVTSEDQDSYLIVNQVRGSECCSEGSTSALSYQIEKTTDLGLAAYFALRYDALVGQHASIVATATRKSPTLVKPALLVEVTPGLAAEAGVAYNGDSETWYKSNQVYTLGYEPKQRRQLIDALMKQYRAVFGTYPELTSGWMIDTDTLNYMVDAYGVKLHQITREQWGVDSYTLHGGPVHYPYPASRNWLFMPDYSASTSALIVRQTISDPVRNYGDLTSAFTSQPNDYALDKKDFSYFEKLADQTLSDKNSVGFMVLGLENSMSDYFQQEYGKQLEWLARQVEQGRVSTATPDALNQTYRQQRPLVFWGKDLAQGKAQEAYWITSGTYRIRLVFHDGHVRITDVRLYHPALQDVYSGNTARLDGYWVAPFIVDATLTDNQPSTRPWWQRLLLPPEVRSSRQLPVSDLNSETNAWWFPDIERDGSPSIQENEDGVVISYESKNGLVTVGFTENSIEITGVNRHDLLSTYSSNQHFPVQVNDDQIIWQVNGEAAYSIDLAETVSGLTLSFSLNPSLWPKLREQYFYYFYPEFKLASDPDQDKTVFYVNNRYALAGRNPVRLVLAPKDAQELPVGLSTTPQVTTNRPVEVTDTSRQQENDVQFIDLNYSEPSSVTVDLNIGDTFHRQETVFFAPDCKSELTLCLQHPQYFYWYARVKIWDTLLSQQ